MDTIKSLSISRHGKIFKMYINGDLVFIGNELASLDESVRKLQTEGSLVEFSASEPNTDGPRPNVMLTVQRVSDDVEINPMWNVHVDAQPAGRLPYWKWKKAVGEFFGSNSETTAPVEARPDITISLTADEALVLYDNLVKLNQSTVMKGLKDNAIQRLSNDIEAMLEPQIDSIFAPDYELRLKDAEKRLMQ